MTADHREFDLVLYGATGFTGGLVAAYLGRSATARGLRWAVAGRDRDRLSRLQERLHLLQPEGGPHGLACADLGDPASLREMAGRARVLLTTVGPYEGHGEPVVAACVDEGTDYLDITGEPGFVRGVVERHGAAAAERGVLVVSCCGFDSIPADLGTLYTVSRLKGDGPKRVQCFVRASGRPSGGTWASALQLLSQGGLRLGHGGGDRPRLHYEPEVAAWALPMPVIDPQIVRRSSADPALPYGPGFTYQQYMELPSLLQAGALAAGVAGLALLARSEAARRVLTSLHPSGAGPSEAQRRRSFFHLTLLGECGGERVRAQVSGGDPGYDETAKMCSEAALLCCTRRADLPRGGVLTPAQAFGFPLIDRLQAAGIAFSSDRP